MNAETQQANRRAPFALIADADHVHSSALAAHLTGHGWETEAVDNVVEAEALVKAGGVNLLVAALSCGGESGLRLLDLDEADEVDEIILMGEGDEPDLVKQGIGKGASYFFCKPFDERFFNELLSDLTAELAQRGDVDQLAEIEPLDQFGMLRGSSKPMKKLYRIMRKVAPTDASVLLIGESGTGKELAAQTIHMLSERAGKPLLAMNCGAVPQELFESELFGHVKGSFTGAAKEHQGFFERADGGTLFLDEITEMPLELQVKLLRVLETGRFRRVGGEQDMHSDVRIIAATNRDPQKAIRDGALREDLYYRVARFPLLLPPLRKRGADVAGLAGYFLEQLNTRQETQILLSDDAVARLYEYHWPGNVRELMASIERAHVLANEVISAELLPLESNADAAASGDEEAVNISVGDSIQDAERQLILATLEAHDGDKKAAAATLGVSLKTLYNRLNEYEQD